LYAGLQVVGFLQGVRTTADHGRRQHVAFELRSGTGRAAAAEVAWAGTDEQAERAADRGWIPAYLKGEHACKQLALMEA